MTTQTVVEEVKIGTGWKGHLTLENIDGIANAIEEFLDGKTFSCAQNVLYDPIPTLNTNLNLGPLKIQVVKESGVIKRAYIRLFVTRASTDYSYDSIWRVRAKDNNSPYFVFGADSFSVLVNSEKSDQRGEIFTLQ